MESRKAFELFPVPGSERGEHSGEPPPHSGSGDLLTIIEAAERLAVGPRFVRRLIAERRIRYFKIGTHIRISAADLETWILGCQVEPTRHGDSM